MGKPRDDKDAAQDLARDLADIVRELASLKLVIVQRPALYSPKGPEEVVFFEVRP